LKSDLDELIEYYESERDRANALLKESLTEFDYLAADAFTKALWEVEHQLDILYKVKDPNYLERKELLQSKDLFENKFFDSPHLQTVMKTERDREAINKFREEELERIKAKLDKIKKYKMGPSLDKEEFDDAIYDLVEGKISAFKLHIKKARNLYLKFERSGGNQLIISFPPSDPDAVDWDVHYVVKMEFHRNEESRRYEYQYDLGSFKNSLFLKTLVARIIFDVFTHWKLDHPAYLEIIQ
jgi:hypothetical protein